MADTFLNREEVRALTGRAHKSLQIKALSSMGVPFFVNGIGLPVVARSVVEGGGKAAAPAPKKAWTPRVLKSG